MQPEKTCGILSIRVIDYTQDRIEEHECIELTEAWSWIGRETVTWIDVVGVPERDELVILGRQAGGIHPLTMEDITAPDQRPKVEEFGNYVAVIARMLSERGGRVASEQVSLIFGENYVITFREQPFRVFEQVRERLRNELSVIRGGSGGPDFLAYTLLDAIVSVYLAILDAVDDRVEDLQGRFWLPRIRLLEADLRTQRRSPDYPESGRAGTRGSRVAREPGVEPCPEGDDPVLPGYIRPVHPGGRGCGVYPGYALRRDGSPYLEPEQQARRDHDDPNHRREHLHPPEFHHRVLRDEPQEHTARRLAARISSRPQPHAGRRGHDAPLLQEERVDMTPGPKTPPAAATLRGYNVL